MEQDCVCRTCLNLTKSKYIKAASGGVAFSGPISVKDMLEFFMPELHLDIAEDAVVICSQCFEALQTAYTFKQKCLETEEKIYAYLHENDIQLGEKISLNNLVQNESITFRDNCIQDDKNCINQLTTMEFSTNNIDTDTSIEPKVVMKIESQSEFSENDVQKYKITKAKRRKRKLSSDPGLLKRSHSCDQCEYKAYRPDLLARHQLKHKRKVLGTKEYKCNLCAYTTRRKRNLDRHNFTHQGKSPHVCKTCNRSFAEKHQLKLHLITHTGQELPHKCEVCGKEYLTKSHLKQHERAANHFKRDDSCSTDDFSREKTYSCDLCDSNFSDKRGLKAHLFNHTGGELPYNCFQCNFSTAWKGNLIKHVKKH